MRGGCRWLHADGTPPPAYDPPPPRDEHSPSPLTPTVLRCPVSHHPPPSSLAVVCCFLLTVLAIPPYAPWAASFPSSVNALPSPSTLTVRRPAISSPSPPPPLRPYRRLAAIVSHRRTFVPLGLPRRCGGHGHPRGLCGRRRPPHPLVRGPPRGATVNEAAAATAAQPPPAPPPPPPPAAVANGGGRRPLSARPRHRGCGRQRRSQ